ncbi:CDP-diacylglycerol diphosphatase, partial [Erwinia amylovora]|nr:CDP-diacylglycerol diphosphatase [Erwinia amylovora]
MEERRVERIDDRIYELAGNTRWGLTQNQLHVHISFLRPDIRQRLVELGQQLYDTLQTYQLGEREFLLRVVTHDEF